MSPQLEAKRSHPRFADWGPRLRRMTSGQGKQGKRMEKLAENDLAYFYLRHVVIVKLCATLSANVNINDVFQSKYTTVFVLLDISESK
jgi:hypothetical protein